MHDSVLKIQRFGMLFPILFIFLPGIQVSLAQPTLNVNRIVNNWPTIELYFTVSCNGTPAHNFNKEQNFEVYENGIEIGEFTLWCPDPEQRCALSVALVFDASGSMSGPGNQGAIAAGNAFVDLMDGLVDEAAIVFFESIVQVRLGMTTNKVDLHDAVDSLPTIGTTAAWDGIYVGVSELINSGNNPCRAVIALTDGGDNSSTHTPQDCISLANRNRIRIYTIGLGGAEPANLELIALLTGGKYYQAPSADQLVAIYQEISTIIYAGFMECVITYQAKCMDGGLRTVDLSVLNFCSGSDTKTKTFNAPKDTSTYIPLEIELGKRKGRGVSEVRVPLDLVTPIDPMANFEKARFDIEFDESCVQFKAIETPPGTLLNGIPIAANPIAGGVSFQVTDRKQIYGNGALAELVFALSDPVDTTVCTVRVHYWGFDQGCFRAVVKDGEIEIEPRAPIAVCNMQMPTELAWVRSEKDFSPNPFQVMCRVFNQGDKDAKNVKFKIDYDPTDFQLISPFSDLQPGTPVDVPVADVSEASWMVKAKPRLSGDSVEICITAMFDNHPNVACCQKIYIPPTEAILECTLSAPVIVADNDNQRYVPMPFHLTVNATNKGGMKSDTVWATIVLPSGLSLAGSDAPNNHTKKVNPALLLPNQTGPASWMLSHPTTMTETEYKVQVWVKTSNADSSLCEYKIIIPPLMAPSLQANCSTPNQLVFNDTTGAYEPNPFNVELQVINSSPMLANNVTAFLWLPDNTVLNPAAQSLTHSFGTLTQFKTGDPIPKAVWTVEYTKKLRYNTRLDFKWSVAGASPTGIPTDTISAYCTTGVPGLKPFFECTTDAPDSLGLDAAETNVEPNPFTYTYSVKNTSQQTAAIKYIEVFYSAGDGIDLHASSPNPKQANVNLTLLPGEETSLSWIFKAANRNTRRLVQIQAVAVDDEGNPISCQNTFPIAALKTALTCNLTSTENPIAYDQLLRDYTNPAWEIDCELTNTGGFQISDIYAELKIVADPFGLVEFNPAFTAVDVNPYTFPVMFMGTRIFPKWHMRLAKQNTTGVSQYVEFSVTYGSNETPLVDAFCNVIVEIKPVVPEIKTRVVPPMDSTSTIQTSKDTELPVLLHCFIEAPDSLGYDDSHTTLSPNPFTCKFRFWNKSNQPVTVPSVEAFVPNDGIALDTSVFGKRQIVNVTLQPGEDAMVSWSFVADEKPRERKLKLRFVALNDKAQQTICAATVRIPSSNRFIQCALTPSEQQIIYDDTSRLYINPSWRVAADFTNTGEVDIVNMRTVLLVQNDSLGLVELNPAFPNQFLQQAPLIPVGGSIQAVWEYRLAKENTTGVTQVISFQNGHVSNVSPLESNACSATLSIQPVTGGIAQGGANDAGSANSGIVDGAPVKSEIPKDAGTAAAGKATPRTYSLGQNKPNPFNPSTTIEYTLAADTKASLTVYNILGRQVRELVNEYQKAGSYRAVFQSDDLPSGVYFYKLETPHYTNIKRMILAK